MKRLSFLSVVVCLLSLSCSAFADVVTNKTEGITKSGNTIEAAYDTTGAYSTQVLELSGDVTESAYTSYVVPVFSSSGVSNITLQSNDGTVRKITHSSNKTNPIFQNDNVGTTINLTLDNVEISGRLVMDNYQSSYKNSVNITGGSTSSSLKMTGGLEEGHTFWVCAAILGRQGVKITNFGGGINISEFSTAGSGNGAAICA